MDRTYERKLPVSSLAVSRVNSFPTPEPERCGHSAPLQSRWSLIVSLFSLCVSVCGQHFLSRRGWSSRVLPLQVSTIFIFPLPPPPPSLFPCQTCALPLPFLRILHDGAFFGRNRRFDLSVLVDFQFRARLCSEQLQIFPVYFFLWNRCHSCVFCEIQRISLLCPFSAKAAFILTTQRQISDSVWTIGMLLKYWKNSVLCFSFPLLKVPPQSKLLVFERLDDSQLDQTVSEVWWQGEGPAHGQKQGAQHNSLNGLNSKNWRGGKKGQKIKLKK